MAEPLGVLQQVARAVHWTDDQQRTHTEARCLDHTDSLLLSISQRGTATVIEIKLVTTNESCRACLKDQMIEATRRLELGDHPYQ